MSKKAYNIVLTCSGGNYIIQNILALRKIKNIKFNIHGIDQKNISQNNLDYLNTFKVCPNSAGESKEYIKFVKKYCLENEIDIFFPLSESEINVLLEIDQASIKTKFILPSKNLSDILSDKLKFFEVLKNYNISNDNFYTINSYNELKSLIKSKKLNYNKIVCKPRVSSGSRGVLIIDESKNFAEPVPGRMCALGGKESIFQYIENNKLNLKNYIITEYFGDNVYDVDSYIVDGDVKYLVSRERQYINPLSPINEGCKITNNQNINKLVKEIAFKLNYTGILDLDIAICKNNLPHIIDVSPRISGSVACSIVADLNIFEVIINHILYNKFEYRNIDRDYILRPVNIYCELIK